jgi:hypothetical protein
VEKADSTQLPALPSTPTPRSYPTNYLRLAVTTFLALGILAAFTIAGIRNPAGAVIVLAAGVGGGILVAIVKRLTAKAFGYKDRSLLDMATSKLGSNGSWAAASLVTGGATAAGYGGVVLYPLAGFIAAEHATNRSLSFVGDLPYHVRELGKTAKLLARMHPRKVLYVGAAVLALVGIGLVFGLMPGDPSTKLFVLAGLAGGLFTIGLVRVAMRKATGQDKGDLGVRWKQATPTQRAAKLTVAFGTLAIFVGTTALLFTGHLSPSLAYSAYGIGLAGMVWYVAPNIPLKPIEALTGAASGTGQLAQAAGRQIGQGAREIYGYEDDEPVGS